MMGDEGRTTAARGMSAKGTVLLGKGRHFCGCFLFLFLFWLEVGWDGRMGGWKNRS